MSFGGEKEGEGGDCLFLVLAVFFFFGQEQSKGEKKERRKSQTHVGETPCSVSSLTFSGCPGSFSSVALVPWITQRRSAGVPAAAAAEAAAACRAAATAGESVDDDDADDVDSSAASAIVRKPVFDRLSWRIERSSQCRIASRERDRRGGKGTGEGDRGRGPVLLFLFFSSWSRCDCSNQRFYLSPLTAQA